REVHALANLRAGAYQRVRVNQSAVVHIGAYVDVHGRHADHALADVAAVANRRTARHHTHVLFWWNLLQRAGVLVAELRLARCSGARRLHWKGAPFGHLDDAPDAKPEQDAFLHPGVHLPAGGRTRVRLSRANPAFVQGRFEFVEGLKVFVAVVLGLAREKLFDSSLKIGKHGGHQSSNISYCPESDVRYIIP